MSSVGTDSNCKLVSHGVVAPGRNMSRKSNALNYLPTAVPKRRTGPLYPTVRLKFRCFEFVMLWALAETILYVLDVARMTTTLPQVQTACCANYHLEHPA